MAFPNFPFEFTSDLFLRETRVDWENYLGPVPRPGPLLGYRYRVLLIFPLLGKVAEWVKAITC